MTRAFLTAGHTGSNEQESLVLDIFGPADGVLKERIAAVNENVPGFKMGNELLHQFIHRPACLYNHHHTTGAFQEGDHFRDGMGADDLGAFSLMI